MCEVWHGRGVTIRLNLCRNPSLETKKGPGSQDPGPHYRTRFRRGAVRLAAPAAIQMLLQDNPAVEVAAGIGKRINASVAIEGAARSHRSASNCKGIVALAQPDLELPSVHADQGHDIAARSSLELQSAANGRVGN